MITLVAAGVPDKDFHKFLEEERDWAKLEQPERLRRLEKEREEEQQRRLQRQALMMKRAQDEANKRQKTETPHRGQQTGETVFSGSTRLSFVGGKSHVASH